MLAGAKAQVLRSGATLTMALGVYSIFTDGLELADKALTIASHWREWMDTIWRTAFAAIGLDIHPLIFPSLTMAALALLLGLTARATASPDELAVWRSEGAIMQMRHTILPILVLIVLNNLATHSYAGPRIPSLALAGLYGFAKTALTLGLLPALTFIGPGKLTAKLFNQSFILVAGLLVAGYLWRLMAPAL